MTLALGVSEAVWEDEGARDAVALRVCARVWDAAWVCVAEAGREDVPVGELECEAATTTPNWRRPKKERHQQSARRLPQALLQP